MLADGALRSLVNLLSMGAFNSLVYLRFGLVVFRILPMLLFHIKECGEQWGGMVQTELVPLPSTALVTLVTRVEPSTPFLLTLRGALFTPALYVVIIAITSSIVGDLRAFGTCTTPVIMVNSG